MRKRNFWRPLSFQELTRVTNKSPASYLPCIACKPIPRQTRSTFHDVGSAARVFIAAFLDFDFLFCPGG